MTARAPSRADSRDIKYNDEQERSPLDRTAQGCTSSRPESRSRSRALVLAAAALLAGFGTQSLASGHAHLRGKLANPGFEGQPMKSTFFFAGSWRFFAEPGWYDGPDGQPLKPATNDCLFTVFPVDGDSHLGWSAQFARQEYALNMMLGAGVNVVNMSWWGPQNTDRWAFWAPMQTAPQANDQVFDAAVGKPILVVPYIEDGAPTHGVKQLNCDGATFGPEGHSEGYFFADTFPNSRHDPAPDLLVQIFDLVERYLVNPAKPAWREKWAQMYDLNGEPRYVIALIHVASNQQVTDQAFADGFGWLADRVYEQYGIRVGFTLDLMPTDMVRGPDSPIRFLADPVRTGPRLARQPAVLAIQSFIPEVHTRRCELGLGCDVKDGTTDALEDLITWKRQYFTKWSRTGIPLILDVSSGYDGQRVFADSVRYGNNPRWREAQGSMLSLPISGITGNSWNGYTETMVIAPSCTPYGHPSFHACKPPELRLPIPGSENVYEWFKALVPPGGMAARIPLSVSGTGPASGVYSDPVRLTARLTKALRVAPYEWVNPDSPITPVAGKSIRFRLGSRTVAATTNAEGVATAQILLDALPGTPIPWTASFAGDNDHLSIEGRHPEISVAKEQTAIRWTGPGVIRGPVAIVQARLTEDDRVPIRGRTLVFSIGEQRCSGETNADGVATCTIRFPRMPGGARVKIAFAGDAYYEAATGSNAQCPGPPSPSPDAECPD
jgi:hypothetical protein